MSLASEQLTVAFLSLYLSSPKPNVPRAARVERTAARRGGDGQDLTPTEKSAQEKSFLRTLQSIVNTLPEQAKSYLNRMREQNLKNDKQIVSKLSAGWKALFFLGC